VGVNDLVVGDGMRDMREQPAGWYRDTERPNLHRYWSGESWSEWFGEELAELGLDVLPFEGRVPTQRNCG
jgi:hypothetical protein